MSTIPFPVGARATKQLIDNLHAAERPVTDDERAKRARQAREMRLHNKAMEAGREARAKGSDYVAAMMAAAFPANATLKVHVAGDMARGLYSQHNRDVYWKYFEAFARGTSFYVAGKFADSEYRYQQQLSDKGRGNILTIAKQARLILRYCRRYHPEALSPFIISEAARFPTAQGG